MEMIDMPNRQQPHRVEKCQFKATHWYLMNDEETFTPLERLQMATTKQYFTQVLRNSCLYILQIHKSKLNVKTK